MIIVIGPVPPPVHGASSVTQRVIALLADHGVPHRVCSNSGAAGARGIRYHLSRTAAALRAVGAIFTSPAASQVYLSVAGGWGVLYDLAFVAAARLRGHRLVVHHHSFAYVDRPSRLMTMLVWLAGRRQSHVALCRCMAERLAVAYPAIRDVQVVSNAELWPAEGAVQIRDTPLRAIGFISNIVPEKGIDRFLELVALLRQQGWDRPVRIAGPIPSDALRAEILQRCSELGEVTWVGAVYGAEKAQFLADVDLLVFPTRYTQEAEPLVILEAQRAGVPVAASSRGCIAEMLDDEDLLLAADGNSMAMLASRIMTWTRDPDAFNAVRKRVAALTGRRETGMPMPVGSRLLQMFAPGELASEV